MLEIGIALLIIWVVYKLLGNRQLDRQNMQNDLTESIFTLETNVYELETESSPDAYDTWYEALNRPVTDRLLFWIEYSDRNGVITERTITPTGIKIIPNQSDIIINAHCNLRDEERSFYSCRIMRTKNLNTNRSIKDLGDYLRSKY